MIARIANEWTRETSISFDFGPEPGPDKPGYYTCGGERKFDVRVGFEASGFWSFIGTDARNVAQDKPTLNLQGIGEQFDVRARRAILHEFGHVLGLLHEEQNPQAGCREELDLDKIKGMGITQQDLDARLAPVTADRRRFPRSGADQQARPRLSSQQRRVHLDRVRSALGHAC